MKKKILILGGSGFIGQNLIKRLIRYKELSITSVSRNSFYASKKKIKQIKCDLTKVKNFKILGKHRYDCIINLSGNIDHNNKYNTHLIHNRACKNIFKFFSNKNVKLFIQVGSSLEYGNIKSPQNENSVCKPISFYGKSKLAATNYILNLAKRKKINFLILRLYQVYGPMQKIDRLIPFAIRNSLMNQIFKCSSGKQLRDFLFIDDLIDLFIKILRFKKIKNGIYNVGYGSPITVKSVIHKINRLVKKGIPLYGAIKMRQDENKINYPNIYKVMKNFKWKPKTDILLGLKKTIKYYEKKK